MLALQFSVARFGGVVVNVGGQPVLGDKKQDKGNQFGGGAEGAGIAVGAEPADGFQVELDRYRTFPPLRTQAHLTQAQPGKIGFEPVDLSRVQQIGKTGIIFKVTHWHPSH